jgi:flavin-dependent dehydrogenase
MNMNIYDVIIVGAGPTGLMLAKQLDDAGLRILLIEKNKTISTTRAGIYGCFRYVIEQLGLAEFVVAEHRGTNLYGRNKMTSFIFEKAPFVTIDMTRWAAGLELKCEKLVDTEVVGLVKTPSGYEAVDANGARHEGRIIADCAGYSQSLGASLGIKKSKRYYYNGAFELENCSIPPNRADDVCVAYDHENSNMGLWFYAYSEKSCQFGLGDIVSDKDVLPADIVERAKRAMDNYPFNEWLKGAKIVKTTVGVGPALQLRQPIARDNFISLGDAGGMGTPFQGEGLRFHLEMAAFAARVIKEAIVKADCSAKMLGKVQEEFLRKFKRDFFYRNMIQYMFKNYFGSAEADRLIVAVNKRLSKDEMHAIANGGASSLAYLKMLTFVNALMIGKNALIYHITGRVPK